MKQSLVEIFEEEKPEYNTSTALRQYARGRIDRDALIESDYFIQNVFSNEERGLSEVEFEFDDNGEVASLLGISIHDVEFYNEVMQNRVAEIFEFDYLEEDFLEGSSELWNWMGSENTRILAEFAFNIVDYDELDFSDWEMMQELNRGLYDSFTNYTRKMIAILQKYLNIAATMKAKITLENDITRELSGTGFRVGYDLKEMTTTVSNLILKYAENNMLNEDLETLVKKVLKNNSHSWFPDWQVGPSYYVQSDNFDFISYNNEIKVYLERIKNYYEKN